MVSFKFKQWILILCWLSISSGPIWGFEVPYSQLKYLVRIHDLIKDQYVEAITDEQTKKMVNRASEWIARVVDQEGDLVDATDLGSVKLDLDKERIGSNIPVTINRGYINLPPEFNSPDNRALSKLALVIHDVFTFSTEYTTDTKKVIYAGARGMVSELDPFSQFMEPEVHKEMRTETKGEFGGLGIRIAIKDRYVTVITPLPGTPAYRAGILPGDKIIKIDGENAEGISITDAVNKLRGNPGTKVVISVLHEGETELVDFPLIREIIKIEVVRSEMLEDKIGYVWVIEFTEQTVDNLRKALQDLEVQGMKSLVIDLRNDPGGLLMSAVEVTKFFIGENKIIVSTKGRIPDQNKEFRANPTSLYSQIPLVVLVNKGSASGSEIVAGAIQDHKRGKLIGSQTFGKGSVQSVIPLEDGSGLRLTTAKYYTPSGKCIHDIGIKPDLVVEVSTATETKLRAQRELVYVKDKRPEIKVKSEERVEDVVILKAIDTLKRKKMDEDVPGK